MSSKIEYISTYFQEPGPKDTDNVIRTVIRRVEREDIKVVVVASTSGYTALKFAETLKGEAKIVAVSHERMESGAKEKIGKLGGTAIDQIDPPLHKSGMDDIRKSFYTLGQGFKVAIEVILMASDASVINLYEDVIGVGGSGEGADTAIVARATKTKDIFNIDAKKKLEIREIIAMPLKKKWWD